MGMSTHVVGFRPPDAKWKQMKAAWDACKVAGVEPPDEVLAFFDHEEPDEAGIETDLVSKRFGVAVATEWSDDGGSGYEVDLDVLREKCPQITKLRFYNSW